MNKVYVLGGAGFIGRRLAVHHRSLGDEVVVVDIFDKLIHNEKNLADYDELSGINVIVDDFVSQNVLNLISKNKPDIIYNLVSQTGTADSNERLDYYLNENVSKHTRLANFLNEINFPLQFILTSSRAVYGNGCFRDKSGQVTLSENRTLDNLQKGVFEYNWEGDPNNVFVPHSYSMPTLPISFYGTSKLYQENVFQSVVRNKFVNCIIVRLQNVIGVGQSMFNPYTGLLCWFHKTLSSGGNVSVFEDGKITRDFIDVDDVAFILERLSRNKNSLPILDIGVGKETQLLEIANLLKKEVGKGDVKTTKQFREGDCRRGVASILELNLLVPEYKPTPLAHTLSKFCEYVQSH
ncbi:NAD-dependent epimerase/dehydratase family protein [Litoribacillus peritrichatus]|uniref:NAD-dependent epimerase/dehydratase family protein n=1 Tax=Litoribacillus peritrichatus TaxID=718191 RepID=A0ABP7M2Y2_9GAMM